MNLDDLKRQAAYFAVDSYVESGMRLGLGTGSTSRHALMRIAEGLKAKKFKDLQGVPTSEETAMLARELGIPLAGLETTPELDLYIDGADEVDPAFNLIKGLGGALLREKITAWAARRVVILVDESKLVDQLGSKAPLPVEVLKFGWNTHERWLQTLGCVPQLRLSDKGDLYHTDGGNYIYDCRFPDGIQDPKRLETALNNRPGILENGLFLGCADVVVVGTHAHGVQVRRRMAA
jgi:ribose 5-phosphate isomerase A